MCKKRVELTDVEEHDDYKIRLYSCGHTSKLAPRSINEPSIEAKDEVTIKKIPWPVTRQGAMILIILAIVFAVGDIVMVILYYQGKIFWEGTLFWGILGIEFTAGERMTHLKF